MKTIDIIMLTIMITEVSMLLRMLVVSQSSEDIEKFCKIIGASSIVISVILLIIMII